MSARRVSSRLVRTAQVTGRNFTIRGGWEYIITVTPASSDPDSTARSGGIVAKSVDHGIRRVYKVGDRVNVTVHDPAARDGWMITGRVPNPNHGRRGTEAPAGTVPHSDQTRDGVVSVGDGSARIVVEDRGNISIGTTKGHGIKIGKGKGGGAYLYSIFEGISRNSSASKHYSRPVRRTGASTEREAVGESADPKFHTSSARVGLFEGQRRPMKLGVLGGKRNVELSETRFVSNEFSESYRFSGFEDEVLRTSGELLLKSRSFSDPRLYRADSPLFLAENELTETIYGNIVDINKNKLDINYNPIFLGSPPADSDGMVTARYKSRRGIGLHFQLTTNSTHSETETYTSDKGFVFSMDKEGAFRLHVPKTSSTGNILYPIGADFSLSSNPNRIEATPLKASTLEGVPVTLRDRDGNMKFPIADEKTGQPSELTPGLRATGIGYKNSNSYFYNSDEAIVNINHTKHHNMYSAAESLIANTIQQVLIPTQYTTKYWIGPGGLTTDDPGDNPLYLELSLPTELSNLNVFEVPFPEGTERTEDLRTVEISEFPQYGGTVAVEPDAPAMYNGGSFIVAGQQNDGPFYSNKFSINDGNIVREKQTIISGNSSVEKEVPNPGGKSANINFEGAIDISIGADEYDKKSLVLDTAGSMVCWLGEDANGRSMIMQTDGDMIINVGGNYAGTDPETGATRGFREGRFDLRVNVTDKGFTTTTYEAVTDPDTDKPVELDFDNGDGNPLYASDYVISIGKHGMVIAGMNPSANMIIRNDGNILIESASGDLTLKGNQVRIVEVGKRPRSSGATKADNASMTTDG